MADPVPIKGGKEIDLSDQDAHAAEVFKRIDAITNATVKAEFHLRLFALQHYSLDLQAPFEDAE